MNSKNPQDLFADIAAIRAALDELLERDSPATAEQLRDITKRKVDFKSEAFAGLVADALTAKLLNAETIKAVADASAQTIADAAKAASGQIAQSGTDAVGEIRQAARQKANDFAQLIGFTSWKAALLIGLIPLLSGGSVVYLWQERQHQQTELTAWKSFGLWVSEKYPAVRAVYDKSN